MDQVFSENSQSVEGLDPLFKYVTSHSKLTRKDPPDVISLKTVDAFFQAGSRKPIPEPGENPPIGH